MARPNCIEAFDARRPVAKRDNRRSRLLSTRRATRPEARISCRGSLVEGNFGPATPFRVGLEANVADFDGDGIADVALNDIDNDRVAIFFGSKSNTGAFVSPIGDYTRLVQNADGTYSRIYNDGTVVKFDASGLQTTIVDANGEATNYSYNGQGQLTGIVDPTGASTSFTYAGAWVASTTDAAGRTTSFLHDAAGNLTQITDPLGNVTKYLYDANNQLIVTIDPNGNRTSNAYTASGQIAKQTYPDGASVALDVSKALGLDALGVGLGAAANAAFVQPGDRITQLEDGDGNISEQEVNEWGAVIRNSDPLGRVSTFTRDAANRVTHSEIPAGVSTGPAAPSSTGFAQIGSSDLLVNDYSWDASGNLIQLHEANGHVPDWVSGSPVDRTTSYVYEPTHNKLVQKTDPDGFVTTWSYDANGNMTATTDALGHVESYTYDARGLALTKTDKNGNLTKYAYDTSGNLARTTDALGTLFDRYYDLSGNAILTIDATGTSVERRRSAKFDANNRLVQQTSATGQTTFTSYDANGNVAQYTDAAGNVTTSVYDGRNRLLAQTTPNAGTTTFNYDANGNQTLITDASGASSSYVYDAANRIIATADGLGATRNFQYDLRDDTVSVTDARGKTNGFTYDILKRVSSRTSPDKDGVRPFLYRFDRRDNLAGAASPAASSEYQSASYDGLSRLVGDGYRNFAYDAAGNVVRIDGENNISLTYAYDALDRRVSESTAGYAVPFGLAFAYDPLSRRASATDNWNATTRYAYDGEDRLTALTTPWGAQIAQSYDAAGRPLRTAYPNGLDADLSFESATGRLASINHRAGSLAAPIARFNHGYDIRGNLATLGELTGTKSFQYDAIERLTGVAQTSPAPATQVESYAYDLEGNRTASHITPSYVTDDANRVLDDGINTYSWSPNGALTTRVPKANSAQALTFWNSWHGYFNQVRLDAIGGALPMRFFYDPLGRMSSRVFDYDATLGIQERYHDGPDVALEIRNRLSPTPQWARYVHGPGNDQPLALELYPPGAPPTPGTGTQFYYHADGEGSIRLLTDSTGQIANRYDYDSYGQRLSVVESAPQPYGWKGRDFVPGPNLVFNRARFYDPVLGRFTSEDPLGFDGGDTNLYSFGTNNPRISRDPSGLSAAEYSGAYAIPAQIASAVVGVGARLACAFSVIDSAFEFANEPNVPNGAQFVVNAATCTAGWRGGSNPFKPPTKLSDVVDNAACLLSSFAEGTLVETKDGLKPIESVVVGEAVIARDAYTGELVSRPVQSLLRRSAPNSFYLTLQSADGGEESLVVTGEHKLFIKARGWTSVREIRTGDLVLAKSGEVPLRVVKTFLDPQPIFVFNLEIAQDHSYLVGRLGTWAHNANGNCKNSSNTTYLYKLVDQYGNFLKWGITDNQIGRYSVTELRSLGNAKLIVFEQGTRAAMLQAERTLVGHLPGPLNFEPWAGVKWMKYLWN